MGAPCSKHKTVENSNGFLSPTLPWIAILVHWDATYAPLPLVDTPSSRYQFELVQKKNFVSCGAVTARAPSFLYHQVRLMVATLVAVGAGDMTPADVQELLAKKDVSFAPPMAPACGLYLARVHYDGSRKWDARRGAGAGRGRAMLHWTHRVTVYVLLALGTPASACGKAIVAVVKRAAPWLAPVEPTVSSIREMRFELCASSKRRWRRGVWLRRIACGNSASTRPRNSRTRLW